MQIEWIAIQPTPYNEYLYKALKANFKDDFSLYYEIRTLKDLPFKENLGLQDFYLENNFRLKLHLIFKAFSRYNNFVLCGWNSLFKICVILIRFFTKNPYFIWTDSVDSSKLNSNPFFLKKLKGLFLNNAKIVFTTGKMGVEELDKVYYFKHSERVVSLPYFTPIPDTQRPKETKIDPIKLLCVSRLVEYKGYDKVIEGLRELVDRGYNVQLKIGGTGPFEEKLKVVVEKNKLKNNVEFLGWLGQDEQLELKKHSHVFIHAPVAHEPYGVVIIENLAFGLPVISSSKAGAGVDRIINGKNGFLINPNNKDEFADAVINICRDSIVYNEYSVNARKLSREWTASKGVEIIKANL